MMDLSLIVAVVILLPLAVVGLSMCVYLGKVWTMRILFRKGGRNHEEK